jgi:hypothetical protein
MGKTKILYEFARLTKMTSLSDANKAMIKVNEDLSCDLILSVESLLKNEFPYNDVFDYKLELQ